MTEIRHTHDPLDIDRLNHIMRELPDHTEYSGTERREYSLTKGDVMLIYRIAKVASGHECPFKNDESMTLQQVARNINITQKIATLFMVTGLVTTILGGIWFALKHLATEFIHNGGSIK